MGKISALSAMGGGTVDRTADFLPIVDTSAASTLKITPNNLLGITGAPVGTTDTQALTNKTIGNTNTLTLKASLLTLQDGTDTTKQAVFSLSGITTATTRTYTLPNASVTLADTSSAQTLTNKTLTSPTITTPTINNPTLNTDTVSEFTSSNGVTVGGVNLKSGALNTNNSIVTANITDSAVTPAKLQSGTGAGWAWASWTPTWTNLTVGNGTQQAYYTQIGKLVTVSLNLAFGNTTSISAAISVSIPVTASATMYPAGEATGIGDVYISGATGANGYVRISSPTSVVPLVYSASGTYVTQLAITSTVPITFTTGNVMSLYFSYQAA